MKRILIVLAAWAYAGTAPAQNLFSAQSGNVTFFSKAPLEDIEAHNGKAQSVINTTTGEIAVKVPIKSFIFENGLMQEHFNENYLESDKYPFATFKGKINEHIDWTKPGTYPVSATGKLNVHGVERDQTIKGKLDVGSGKLQLDADFTVALADHKIEIPTLVFQKIAETIAVTTRFFYQPHVKQ
jgi:polyisoprenoid-binding protein YceI